MRLSKLSDSSVEYDLFPEPPHKNPTGWGAYTRYYKLDRFKGLKVGHTFDDTVNDLVMYSILRRVFPRYGIKIPKIYDLAVMKNQTKSWNSFYDSGDEIYAGYIVEHIAVKHDSNRGWDDPFDQKIGDIAHANGLEAWDTGWPNTLNEAQPYIIDLNSIYVRSKTWVKEKRALTKKVESALKLILANEKA